MFAITLSLFYAAFLYVFAGSGMEASYSSATSFLYWWYFFWSIVLGVIVLGINLIVILGLTVEGAEELGGKLGGFLGFAGGGAISIFLSIVFLFRRVLYVGGAYLLNTALILNANGVYEWENVRLVLGALFLLIAVMTRSRSSSSSSSHSD
ncbi:MAG: hypothetical protein WC514_03325 [Candidatus Paceibacterota bacterium]